MTVRVPVGTMNEDATGRFAGRPVYRRPVIDEACENIVAGFLRERHGAVSYPVSTDDLVVLVERETEFLDLFADLDVHGGEVEGVTVFEPGRKPVVRISARLTLDPCRVNRFRSTLAHEYGHILLHGFLAEDGPPRPVPEDRAGAFDWMEWQANYAIGALLMPRTALADAVARLDGDPVPPRAGSSRGRTMISAVSQGFEVSRAAARVRLEQHGHLAGERTS